ncbi:MAG: hypothetical protein IK025_05915 [Bacteroidales bacterium]|nr:hypothetical protein [Bacteroidales bacterium]
MLNYNHPLTKKIITHTVIVLLFFVIAVVYMHPILGGKIIAQGDVMQYRWTSSEYAKFKQETGETAYWNSSAFCGMPMYQMHNIPSKNLFQPLKYVLTLTFIGEGTEGRNCDWGIIFLYLLGFYVALLALGLNPWLSLLGAIAFGFGSYNIIIIETGHITKAWAISMIAPILAGMILAFRKKYLWGMLLFTIALGLQIQFNHIQITYYTMLMAVVVGIVYLVYSIKNKEFKHFAKGVGGLVICAMLVLLSTSRYFMVNAEYVKHTMRGGSEITVNEHDLYGTESQTNTIDGLDAEYASEWSYGKAETMTLLVPGFYGGSSDELYWGDQRFTNGTVYIGAIIVFLFILGLLIVKEQERWWLLATAIIGILLAWGSNLQWFNVLLRNYLPMYNKFRSPSMSLVIVSVSAVVMALLALRQIFNDSDRKKYNIPLYISAGITLITCALVAIVGPLTGSFSGAGDAGLGKSTIDALVADRKAMMMTDAWRSFGFVLATAVVLWLYVNNKLKNNKLIIVIIGLLVIVDLIGIDNRYLNDSKYIKESALDLKPDDGDRQIYKLAEENNDIDYRVFNIKPKQGSAFNDARTSAFHHSAGGYSAVKLGRYQDIMELYLAHYNKNVMNMLNIRYFLKYKDGAYQVRRNADAYGNAWFVDSVKYVDSVNEEILALNDENLKNTAIVNKNEFIGLSTSYVHDSTAEISLVFEKPYNPNSRKYSVLTNKNALAVFSEIYYSPDWRAYIDGNPAEYFRANYLLRAMEIPAGEHTIEFRNEAPTFHKWETVELASSIFLAILIIVAIFLNFRKKKTVIN